jgi:hypothetical protein
VPQPRSDRERWMQELDEELPALIESCQRELAATPGENTPRRERLAWQIRQAQRRRSYLRARLGRAEPER